MLRRTLIHVWAVLLLTALAGCGSDAAPASPAATAAQPTRAPVAPSAAATAAPTAAALAETAAPTAAAAQPEGAGAIPEGQTPEGYHMRGRPDAPVTLVMYSDFL